MYTLRRFHGPRFERINALIDSLEGHITSYVNLIGSASLPLPEVCSMEGLPGTACRAEGHLHGRLFPGTDPIDRAESLIEDEIRRLFEVDRTYGISGQPHSATQANHAVFRAVLGDSGGAVACLSPSDGGHISHQFGLPPKTNLIRIPIGALGIDYDALAAEVQRARPAMIVAGGTSYTRAFDYPRLRQIADRGGSHLHADLAHTGPFVVGGQHPPAFPFVDSATIDTSKNLRGPRGGVLVYRDQDASAIERAIFPILQSSPNQTGLLAKAACLTSWTREGLRAHATKMIRLARVLGERVEPTLGTPVYGGTETHLLLFDLAAVSIDGRAAEEALEAKRILVNRNQVPGDTTSPWAPRGMRIGTTALAILDYTDDDAAALGDAVGCILRGEDGDAATIDRLLETYHRPLVNNASGRTS
jgi:glycine hydroxymethyltransferase